MDIHQASINLQIKMPPKKQSAKTVVIERVVTTKETRVTYHSKPEPKPKKKSGACHRCGRTSHWIADCYAKTDTDGNDIDSDDD
jgi:hypothetical protein